MTELTLTVIRSHYEKNWVMSEGKFSSIPIIHSFIPDQRSRVRGENGAIGVRGFGASGMERSVFFLTWNKGLGLLIVLNSCEPVKSRLHIVINQKNYACNIFISVLSQKKLLDFRLFDIFQFLD